MASDNLPRRVCLAVIHGAWTGAWSWIRAIEPGWTVRYIPCGHDAPIDMPKEPADLLLEAADGLSGTRAP